VLALSLLILLASETEGISEQTPKLALSIDKVCRNVSIPRLLVA
jgi:hypothetical protein